MRVVMIGATGLVGSLIADGLLADELFEEVHAVTRRASGRRHARWREHVARAGDWPAIAGAIKAEAAVSALGTTMRAAGGEAGFRAVDLDMVTAFAHAALGAGAQHMLTVSSVGADPGSRSFYLRIKAEMELELRKLGVPRLDVLRPGLLRGPRGGERRWGERIGIALSPLVNIALRGPLDRYAAIDAAKVADAAVVYLREAGSGHFVHENRDILRQARKSRSVGLRDEEPRAERPQRPNG